MRKSFFLFLTFFLLLHHPLWASEYKASYSGENAERLIPAESGEDFGFGVEADFVSQYVWRGIALSEGPVLQPSMWFSFYGATLSVWGNFVLNDEANQGQLNEVDFNLGYVYQYKNFFVGSLFLFYLYPHQEAEATGEGSIILGFQMGPFKIFTAQLIDMIASPGAYFGLAGGSFEEELHPKLSLKTSVGMGWANGKFNEVYFEVPLAKANVFVWNLDLSWYVHDPLYLRPHMKLTTLLSSDLRDSVEEATILSGGLALGVEF
jgi:hypothetical protein